MMARSHHADVNDILCKSLNVLVVLAMHMPNNVFTLSVPSQD